MNSLRIGQLDSAINALCPDIWSNIQSDSEAEMSEDSLWEELVCCVLSSQVKFELSQAVTAKLKQSGLLDLDVLDNLYESRVSDSLKSPVTVNGRAVKYRFPNAKAKQIAAARENIYGRGLRLRGVIDGCADPLELRNTLVDMVPGLGMKQASMYLRNVSNTFELAVIDSHVLKYMEAIDLIKAIPSSISKSRYLAKESALTKYAEKFGHPVGCVDYAIWIVMRVARRGGYL